ncbi:MAG: hypothetical protein IPJ40_01745 [Saprospirales bacterium]|nr:hypothetical protein [Saprospirales bacterium]
MADTLSGDTLDNGQWFRFQVCESEVVFECFAYNCAQNGGVEVALFFDPDSTGANLQLVSALQPIGNGFTDTLSFSGLTPGAFYLVLIDGVDGDICEFQLTNLSGLSEDMDITAINEVLVDGYIDGPTEVCPFPQLPTPSFPQFANGQSLQMAIRLAPSPTNRFAGMRLIPFFGSILRLTILSGPFPTRRHNGCPTASGRPS